MQASSIMSKEAQESAKVISGQLISNETICADITANILQNPPKAIMMIGRGTSDHAGVFAKYLFEVCCGIPVCAAAPSVAGIFNRTLSLDGCVAIAISQSGKSPDIVRQMKLAKEGGAYCVALVNEVHSPLAESADIVLPLCAGPEKAVAATKSYLASLSALCQLIAYWKQDKSLLSALNELPEKMFEAQQLVPKMTLSALKDVKHCIVLGRGFGYAIAREIALKLKEVLSIHAEAFSSAEFIHGPVTLAESQLTVINVTINDETEAQHRQQLEDVALRGANIVDISVPNTTHPRLHALLIMQRFYLDIEIIASQLGLDPDAPPGLNKVTETK